MGTPGKVDEGRTEAARVALPRLEVDLDANETKKLREVIRYFLVSKNLLLLALADLDIHDADFVLVGLEAILNIEDLP